jgi:hypothetical protein
MAPLVDQSSHESEYHGSGGGGPDEFASVLARERMGGISCAHRFLKRVLFDELDATPDLDPEMRYVCVCVTMCCYVLLRFATCCFMLLHVGIRSVP